LVDVPLKHFVALGRSTYDRKRIVGMLLHIHGRCCMEPFARVRISVKLLRL